MNGIRTRSLVVFEWLVILVLVTGGVVLGVLGTASATIDLPGRPLDIEVGQASFGRDVIVQFHWTMMSGGEVEINAFATSHAGAPDPSFTIVLYCGARLTDIEGAEKSVFDGTGIQDTIAAGDEGPCRAGETEGRARQIFHIVRSTKFTGFLQGNWNDSKAGQRVARTPSVGFSGAEPDLREVSAASTFMAFLTAPASTPFESATPGQLDQGEVVYGSSHAMIDRNNNYELAAVQWETAAKPLNTPTMVLGSGIARWTLLGGQSLPQWSLLLSGVFLGIAAALLVECPISSYRARLKAQAETVAGAEEVEAERRREADARKASRVQAPRDNPKKASAAVPAQKNTGRRTPNKSA